MTEKELEKIVPRFMRAAQRLTDDDHVCLHAAEAFHFCLAGAGGLTATHAPTPALALETFGRYVPADTLLKVGVTTTSEETIFKVEVVAPWPASTRRRIVEGFFAGMLAALRPTIGGDCVPLAVSFAAPEPNDTKPLRRALGAPLLFGRPANQISFATPTLTKTSLLYDPLLYEQLSYIADLGTARPSGVGPLRQLVEQAIRGGAFSIEAVAKTLQMSVRTLQRRLQLEGISFRVALIEGRVKLAEELLLTSDLTVAAIAEHLDYSDDKAFRRAVKQVTGRAPTEIRAAREADEGTPAS